MRLIALAAVVLMATLAWPAVAQQAPAPAPGPAPSAPSAGPGPGRMGAGFDMGRMIDMLAQRLNLTPEEKAITEKAVRAKMDAAMGLSRELEALGAAARNDKSSDQELSAALKKYAAALAAYRKRIKDIDAQLSKGVSLRARAGLTAIGVLDNGLGLGGGRFGGFGGRTRRGAGEGAGGTRGYGGAPSNPTAPPTGMPQVVR
jgi:Spy/CpxP family protein refolding chaperone